MAIKLRYFDHLYYLHRMSRTQAYVLYTLAHTEPGITGIKLAKLIGIPANGIYIHLKRLLEVGYVEQGRVPHNPMAYSITKLGWKVVDAQQCFINRMEGKNAPCLP